MTESRFTDGPLSLSHKVTFQEYETEDEIESVVQLRHHADVFSLNAIDHRSVSPSSPTSLSNPGRRTKQGNPEMRTIQINAIRIIGDVVHPSLGHDKKLDALGALRAFPKTGYCPAPTRTTRELNSAPVLTILSADPSARSATISALRFELGSLPSKSNKTSTSISRNT